MNIASLKDWWLIRRPQCCFCDGGSTAGMKVWGEYGQMIAIEPTDTGKAGLFSVRHTNPAGTFKSGLALGQNIWGIGDGLEVHAFSNVGVINLDGASLTGIPLRLALGGIAKFEAFTDKLITHQGLEPITDANIVLGTTSKKWSEVRAVDFFGAGSNITALNASNIASGALADARLSTNVPLKNAANVFTAAQILDNQNELRFREATANGVNFVGFKAPASITVDKIWTLPAADGSVNQVLTTDGAGVLSWTAAGTGVTGSGTANKIPKWTSASVLGDSRLTDDGTNIVISSGKITGLTQGAAAGEALHAGRQIISGGGLTGGGDLTADRTLAVGAGTGITVNADDIAINQAFAPTWTGVHTFNPGTTPTEAVVFDIDSLAAAGQRDSHIFRFTGKSFDTLSHQIDWRMFVDVTSNAGVSQFVLQSRIDAVGFADRFLITDGGAVTATSFSGSGLGLTSLNAGNIASGTLADARLSSNVPLKNATNSWAANQLPDGNGTRDLGSSGARWNELRSVTGFFGDGTTILKSAGLSTINSAVGAIVSFQAAGAEKAFIDAGGKIFTKAHLEFEDGQGFSGVLSHFNTALRDWTFPNASGDVCLTTITNIFTASQTIEMTTPKIDFKDPSRHWNIGISTATDSFFISDITGVVTRVFLRTDGTIELNGNVKMANTVNTVNPTSPNRTVTLVMMDGTTLYVHAKTTND